jgi:hypothetical protein
VELNSLPSKENRNIIIIMKMENIAKKFEDQARKRNIIQQVTDSLVANQRSLVLACLDDSLTWEKRVFHL